MRKPNYGRPPGEEDEWRDETYDGSEEDDSREWIGWHLGEGALEKVDQIIGKYELHSYEDLTLRAIRVILHLEEQENDDHPLAFVTTIGSPEGTNPEVRKAQANVASLDTLLDKAGYEE